MKHRVLFLLSLLILALVASVPVAAVESHVAELQPGEQIVLEQNIPINLVFIGYDQHSIGEEALLAELPATYEPVVRVPQFYGLPGRPLGLHFTFDYNVQYASAQFEDRFFRYLTTIGEPGAPTLFQQEYNAQENNVLEVTDPVLYIDGPSVERWLESQSRRLQIDTRRSYTIYFINWYGRDDFNFHVYTKTDQPDPDTGFNFGQVLSSRKLIAWGGSHGRSWFYDLSAGPEAWTDNWNVDTPDLDGDGAEEYRMPPIWEYTAGGYRSPEALSSDLGLVTRFVGINLLFTTSPLYDPLVTAPGLDGDKIVHVEMFEDDPDNDGTDWIDTRYINDALAAFQPYYDWQTHLEDNDPIDAGAERAFRIATGLLEEDDCWNDFGTIFAEFFCYFDANLSEYVPPYGPEDYVAPVFAFNTTDENMGGLFGLLGFADDNWVDGTQSFVFAFDSPTLRDFGYGFSITAVHEVGHHIGMSHPHDGYDSELDIDYGPVSSLYFAWSGDESDTIMSYIDLNRTFGQFDQDNMYRYETAGYLNWSSELLADILAHPDADSVRHLIVAAGRQAEQAHRDFYRWNYLSAAGNARGAYEHLLWAADVLGIESADLTFSRAAVPDGTVPRQVDPIRYPDK